MISRVIFARFVYKNGQRLDQMVPGSARTNTLILTDRDNKDIEITFHWNAKTKQYEEA